jgi:hypothetical protein
LRLDVQDRYVGAAEEGPMEEGREAPDLLQTEEGVFGLEVVVQDFDEADVAALRRIAGVIRTPRREGVRSAIALSGSAAESRFQPFPGDCDFFERVNIAAQTREEALRILTSLMLETIGHVFVHPDLQFAEMWLGLHAFDSRRGERSYRLGEPVAWELADIDARSFPVEDAEGNPQLVELSEVASRPGFVKLDWVMADRERDRIVAVSKVIDATWESPDGAIVALDGVLDGFYQEVYLDPDSRSHVERIIRQAEPSGLRDYVDQLEGEVRRYTAEGHENYGKVAKRLYNIFRITKRADLAANVRALFDDPAARLYQVDGGLHALEQVLGTARLDPAVVQEQINDMTDAVEVCSTRPDKADIIRMIESLPELDAEKRQSVIDDIGARVGDEVSDYFRDRLLAEPGIAEYLTMIRAESEEGSDGG